MVTVSQNKVLQIKGRYSSMRYLLIILLFCSGCVTTSKCSLTCNKTLDLNQQPIDGRMNVGVRLEFFRDHRK